MNAVKMAAVVLIAVIHRSEKAWFSWKSRIICRFGTMSPVVALRRRVRTLAAPVAALGPYSIGPSWHSTVKNKRQILLSEFIDGIGAAAILEAHARGLKLIVSPAQDGLAVEADRQILAAVPAPTGFSSRSGTNVGAFREKLRGRN